MKCEPRLKICRMKYLLYSLLLSLCVVSACHRKTVSARSRNEPVKPLLSGSEAAGESSEPSAPAATVYSRPVIIVDAKGNFAVTDKTLPADAPKAILDPSNARAYTPAQTKTLAYRFGKVPPRILYVPTALTKKSAKGTYYILDKKFWYWKRSNGYFYIDDNYFK